jgi:hypothetical protein
MLDIGYRGAQRCGTGARELQRIVALAAVDCARCAALDGRFDAIVACTTKNDIPFARNNSIIVSAAVKKICAIPADENVIAAISAQNVVSATPDQNVITSPAIDNIVAIVSIENVVATQAADGVIADTPDEGIVTFRSCKILVVDRTRGLNAEKLN